MRHILLVLVILAATTGVTAAQKLAGYTIMNFDHGHGTTLEYLAPDGRTHLLYPLNAGIVVGDWRTEGEDICFRYPKNTYDPIAKKKGGKWGCVPLASYADTIVERAKGDVFNLATGKLPFQHMRDRTTIAKLRERHRFFEEYSRVEPVPPKEHCDEVIANQRKNREAMIEAARLYFHGMWMGERCVPVDYLKAFELLREAGDTSTQNSFLRTLRARASSGNPKAIAALQKLEP